MSHSPRLAGLSFLSGTVRQPRSHFATAAASPPLDCFQTSSRPPVAQPSIVRAPPSPPAPPPPTAPATAARQHRENSPGTVTLCSSHRHLRKVLQLPNTSSWPKTHRIATTILLLQLRRPTTPLTATVACRSSATEHRRAPPELAAPLPGPGVACMRLSASMAGGLLVDRLELYCSI